MGAFDYANPSGVWANEMVPGASHYWRWDVTQSKLVNGDAGGTWDPTSPIIIGGQGLQFHGPGCQLLGGVKTTRGGRIVLRASDVPLLSPTRTVTRTMALVSRGPAQLSVPPARVATTGGNVITYPVAFQDAAFAPLQPGFGPAGMILETDAGVGFTEIPIPSAYQVQNASLLQVGLSFRVLNPGLPNFAGAYPLIGPTSTTTGGNPVSFLALQLAFNALPWRAGTPYSTTQYVCPNTRPSSPDVYLRCTTPGTSGAVEPTWPTTQGATVTDGSVVWTCVGPTGRLVPTGPNAAATYFSGGASQTLWSYVDASFSTRTTGASLLVQMANWPTDGSILFHSIQLVYGFIAARTWL